MKVAKPKTIQTKFLLGLAAIALGGGLIFSFGLYFHLRGLLESEVAHKAELILSQVEAVRRYVRETLRPVMYGLLPEDEFIIEAMSTSYISRKVMENVDSGEDPFTYRRVSIDARNPQFEATEREATLVRYFQDHPKALEISRFETIEGLQYYLIARPVRFGKSCMNCHGEPADAPAVLIERYGDRNGFGRIEGSVGGVTSVIMPVGSALSRIRGATLGYVLMAIFGTFICFAVVNILFNRVVIQSLRGVLDAFPRYFGKQAHQTLFSRLDAMGEEGDEIDEIQRSVEELASNLSTARSELEKYAKNLEGMVEERTKELSLEAMERRSDVLLFVGLLDGLNQSQTRRELIETALPKIGERYRAREAAFVCTLASQNSYSWPVKNIRPQLPEDWPSILAESRPVFTYDTALIPVQPNDTALEGYLILRWDEDTGEEPGQMRDVLIALGRQLGIAMENINALDNLLRQNDVLASIFEGIADPLLLMDGACNIIIANQAARALAQYENIPAKDVDILLARMLGIDPAKGKACPLRQVLEDGTPKSYETELLAGRSFALNIYPVPGSKDRGGRAVIYVRENSSEKRMLARLQQNEKLITVGKLAAGLAHEINNPLGIILCYAELLRSAASTDQSKADVEIIINHTKQAQRVLQDLLNFARPRKATKGPCDPLTVITTLCEVFSVQAEKRGASIKLDLPQSLPRVNIGPESLEQIISNLLLNAIDACGDDQASCSINVSASEIQETDEVVITIRDNGPGIAPHDLPRIFDPFFTTKEVGKGSGLGLAVVYGLMQQVGGRIDVDNADGAVFTLTLPAKNQGDNHLE
ncbi:c-type heme family protein [Desulfovibrio ferrophilus]|uniref:histidine kinase n=1 Tax=Desulfovibrio ferrophilus TaxID=241368 RepID=A0A2Z6B164_9BACT|nr:DUF3365 domain-containing protein [Desulfovibrio ferrophilus]BBD09188.1 sensor histidine kinase [Desulfovibrio ferrophilus]